MEKKEKIDFIAEETNKINKTKDEIIDEIMTKNEELPDPDEIVKKYESYIINNKTAENIIIELQDGSEYSYSRLPNPKCQICKSIYCEDVEKIYLENGFDLKGVRDFFAEKGLRISPFIVRKHFDHHCDFNDIQDSWLAQAQLRKEEIIEHSNELSALYQGDVINTILFIKKKIQADPEMGHKEINLYLSNLAKFESIRFNYEKLRQESKEFKDELLNDVNVTQSEELNALFAKLLQTAETPDMKKKIAKVLQEFTNYEEKG